MPPEERTNYESSLKYYRDMNNVVATAKGEGWDEGWQDGMQQGMQQEAAKTLLKILNKRFGSVPPSIRERIGSATSSQLEVWIEASLDAGSIQQVLHD
jgi:hypothetical protein